MGRIIHYNKIAIFCFDIKRTVKLLEINEMPTNCKNIDRSDAEWIVEFYRNNNYGMYLTLSEVEKEFEKGYKFYGVKKDNEIVAGMWIHSGNVNFDAPSFEALKEKHNHIVHFHDRTIYSSHNLVTSKYRGNHLYSTLLEAVLYSERENADYYIYITGFDNTKMIKSGIKFNGQIIGIAYILRFFKYIWFRKRYFFGDKHWESKGVTVHEK